ncbi:MULTISPECIES: PH domain-containing protein [Anaerotruncus]|nr:PH domain-containing protein [Anaerotruncus massiliensis (ex Togo et al. 2019)]
MRKAASVHAHPFSMLTFLYRFLFLLIIPLARGFLSALTGDLLSWISGAWMDILTVLLIFLLAWKKWDCFKYYMDECGVFYTSGIFFKRETFIPVDRICTCAVMRPFWLRPLKVARLRVDTIARGANKADVSFYVGEREAARILSLCRGVPEESADEVHAAYRPRISGVVFLSLFTSNSFLGIVFISTFISQAGQILGQELADLMLATFEELSRRVAFGLPPIAAGVAIALLVGWLAAFLLNLLQTKNLCTLRVGDSLHVSGGVLVEKEYFLRARDISFVDIRQSLLTRLLGRYSVFLNAIGFNKDKSDISAVIPFSSRGKTREHLSRLLPEYTVSERTLKPNLGAIFKFLIDPFWPCVLIPAGTVVACWLLPKWTGLIGFAGFMLSLPALWFLGVRILDFLSSGVSRDGDCYTLRYSNRYYLHTVVFPFDKIALVNVRQSILQRGDRKCDLKVSTRAEGRFRHHIRNLDWDGVVALFDAGDEAPSKT